MQTIDMKRLIAGEGKILTNGTDKGYVVDVPESEMNNWYEINDVNKE